MDVYVTVFWFYNGNGSCHSTDTFKISDTISYDRYKTIYKNSRFDDYYIIEEAKDKIINFIKSSPKHEYLDAMVSEYFLPNIFIEAKNYLDNF